MNKRMRERKAAKREIGCDGRWNRWSKRDRCGEQVHELRRARVKSQPVRRPQVNRVNRDTIQNLEINGLKQEVSALHSMVSMLMSHLDPEDVQAIVKMAETRHELTHDMLLEMARECSPPAELFGVD